VSLKAILLVLPADSAQEIANLIGATLTLNGYHHTRPEVMDWPLRSLTDASPSPLATRPHEGEG
jgi:hypothetical protein